jgi:hypothetical protein
MKKSIIALLIMLVICAVLWAATGDEYAVLTSSVERRNQEPLIKPVWEHVITWTYDADDAGAETQELPVNGILLKVIMKLPLTTTTGTTEQLLILDNGDNTIFDSTEVGENATHTFNVYEPVTGTLDLILEPSAASGDAVTPKVITLRGI